VSLLNWQNTIASLGASAVALIFGGARLQAGVDQADPPETRSPASLKAINDPGTGKTAFSFDGREDPPVIRVNPGEG
jgi:hypothetical protein